MKNHNLIGESIGECTETYDQALKYFMSRKKKNSGKFMLDNPIVAKSNI